MAANNTKVEDETVQYISTELVDKDVGNNMVQLEVGDGENEYNINVAYANESGTVFVQQGQYVIPVSGHTVVLQDDQGDFEQYIIGDMGDELQDAEEIEQPILYYTGDFPNQAHMFDESEETSVEEGTEEKSVLPLAKQIKMERNYVEAEVSIQENVDVESNLVQLQEGADGEKVLIASGSTFDQLQQPQYQYAILKNGKLHLQTLDVMNAPASNQFTIAEDDDQHQQLQEQLAAFQQSINLDDPLVAPAMVDLDKITGKNLITGQTVTLDSYFDKLQRRLATVDVTNQCLTYNPKKRQRDTSQEKNSIENTFINKKVVVGKTSSGKRIVGKILRIHTTKDNTETEKSHVDASETAASTSLLKKGLTNTTEPCDEEPEPEEECMDADEPPPHIIIKKHVITRENFDYSIGKTLSGLMGLETVQRRLQNRNLVVKLVEKVYDHSTDNFSRTVSYVYGHMELVNPNDKSESRGWVFVLHNENASATADTEDENTNEADASGLSNAGDDSQQEQTSSEKTPDSSNEKIDTNTIKDVALELEDTSARINESNETTSLTIIITVDKNGKKSTRVNLSPQHPDNRCYICSKEFKSSLHMRKHISNVHMWDKSATCELCGKRYINQAALQRHRKIHMGERWYQCPKCSKSFNTAGSLKRHLTVHDPSLRPLECSVCVQRFTDESSLRKHLLIHTGIRAFACDICNRAFVNKGDLNFHRRIHDAVKQFSCEVCGREFSRHSNLMRHAEIHRGAGALHRCDLCGCSYSFISSLTRHIVQKHIGHQQQQ